MTLDKTYVSCALKRIILPDSIMVVRQILALYVRVRILIGQQSLARSAGLLYLKALQTCLHKLINK